MYPEGHRRKKLKENEKTASRRPFCFDNGKVTFRFFPAIPPRGDPERNSKRCGARGKHGTGDGVRYAAKKQDGHKQQRRRVFFAYRFPRLSQTFFTADQKCQRSIFTR